jgi:BON domain
MCEIPLPSMRGSNAPEGGLLAAVDEARSLLRTSSYSALREISCVADDGALYLRGRVPSHYLKQLAQELASRVDGVRLVKNLIEVTAQAAIDRPRRSGHVAESIQLPTRIEGGCSSPSHPHDGRRSQPCWS